MGNSFGFLPTNIAIANSYGISGLLGASLVGGLFCGMLGFSLKKLRKFFPKAKNWIVALLVLIIVILINTYAKGMAKTSSILIGIIVGYLVALSLNMVDFSSIKEASWFSLPKPFYFPMDFKWGAILPMSIMFIVTAVETVGDVTAITVGGAGREPIDDELSGSVIANGLTSSLAAVFNSLLLWKHFQS